MVIFNGNCYDIHMKKLIKIFLTQFIFLNSFTLATHFSVNNEHSKIKFKIGYMGISEVEGRFTDYKAYFHFNDNSIKEIRAVIKAKSIDTFDKKRDSHLIKKDFFHVTKYPEIKIWSSEKLTVKVNEQVETKFYFKIKNKKKLVPVLITYIGNLKDPLTEKVGHYFSLKAKINRLDFDITWNKKLDNGGLLLSNEVEINGDFETYPVGDRPAFSRFFTPDKESIKRIEVDMSGDSVNNKELKKKPNFEVIPKKSKRKEKEIFTVKNLTITFFTGFTLFLLMIALSYFGQKYITEYLEKMGLGERATYVITNTIIMVIIIILAIVSAPYMGLGPNPLS